MTSSSISVVVPVYDSAELLTILAERLKNVLNRIAVPYEVLFVNDASTDASWDRIVEVCSADACFRGLNLMRNYGQHNALLAGIRAARHEIIVTLDDDLQNPPEEIPKLLAALDGAHDVVYGSATVRQQGVLRDVATRLTKFALRGVIGSDIAGKVSAYRAFRAELRDSFASFQGHYVSIDVLLSWGTTRFTAVPVAHRPRAAGKSHYTVAKLATHALNVLTGFSTRPLRAATLVGLVTIIFGICVLGLVLATYFIQGRTVPGFAFLASVITIFSGAQLLSLGIIGEYLARMHIRIMDRPPYAIREEVGAAATSVPG